MDLVLWIVSGVLAAVYLMAGITKLAKSREQLLAEPRMAWAGDFAPNQIKAIGAAEVLGALGLVLPWLTGIAPVLTPVAAAGLAVLQIGAAYVHGRRHETATIPVNVVLAALAAFVAVTRFGQL
ncbi:DoxX family protein [Lentzea guizhouensis]|uniref:DoxX family protein n=1 Tax=Lentzea guizhouensis TaxID=1586287 RepID=A0A1B2HSR1_9PSEU|nr:DoxX family protein [Lentzea guizhouensis]ANZ40741.1 DoxX family protein [Lentzea guizhouensis]